MSGREERRQLVGGEGKDARRRERDKIQGKREKAEDTWESTKERDDKWYGRKGKDAGERRKGGSMQEKRKEGEYRGDMRREERRWRM